MRLATTRMRQKGPGVEPLEGRRLLASLQQFPVPPVGTFVGPMVPGPGGDVWFLKQTKSAADFSLELTSSLARIGPDGKITDYPLPDSPSSYGNGPQAIASGPDGSLYILTESTRPYSQTTFGLDRISPDGTLSQIKLSQPIVSGQFLKYPGLTLDSPDPTYFNNLATRPNYTSIDLTVGGNGDVYLASAASVPFTTIDRISPDGTVDPIAVNRYAGGPLTITADGSVWFGTMTTPNGADHPFTEIVRLSPDGRVSDFFLPDAAGSPSVPSIVAGADGNVYFSDLPVDPTRAPLIGKITPAGQITEYPLSNPGGGVGQLARGADGNVDFTETANVSADPSQPHVYKVGEIDHAGVITETTVNSASVAFVDADAGSITTGPNGQLWFAENSYAAGSSTIGELTLPHGSLTVTSMPRTTVRGGSTEIALGFSQALNPASARSLANYRLEVQARPGHPAHAVRIARAVYNATLHTVTLRVAGRLDPRLTYQVTVNGSTPRGVASAEGVILSGNGSGLPGSNFLAILPRLVPAGSRR